jgi:hypothetical protein
MRDEETVVEAEADGRIRAVTVSQGTTPTINFAEGRIRWIVSVSYCENKVQVTILMFDHLISIEAGRRL